LLLYSNGLKYSHDGYVTQCVQAYYGVGCPAFVSAICFNILLRRGHEAR